MGSKLTKNAEKLLQDRYYQKNEKSWNDICDRVSTNIASCESDKEFWKEKFYEIMNNLDFIPSTPCLINGGTYVQQLSSCFIIDIKEDSLDGILDAVVKCGKIFQKNGGNYCLPLTEMLM